MFFSLSGHIGLFMTHGSIRIVFPPGVSIRKVACPNHVSLMPFRLGAMPTCSLRFSVDNFPPSALTVNPHSCSLALAISPRSSSICRSEEQRRGIFSSHVPQSTTTENRELTLLPFLPPSVPARQRNHVPEPRLLQRCSRQSRPASTSAIEHQLLVLVGRHLIDIVFHHAPAHGHSSRDHPFVGFRLFPHVNQDEILSALLHPIQIGGVDLLDLLLSIFHQRVELGHCHRSNSPPSSEHSSEAPTSVAMCSEKDAIHLS